MKPVEDVLRNWQGCIDGQYLLENTDRTYTTKGLIPDDNTDLQDILFNKEHTRYGILLRGPKDGRCVDSAVIGFNADTEIADCLEIHGATNSYETLRPVRWDAALLQSLIRASEKAHLRAVHVIPAIYIEGVNKNNYHRLEKRYDHNALAHGFSYSQELRRYILEF